MNPLKPLPFLHVSDASALPDSLKGAAVAVGNFDGVHLGHKVLLDRAVTWAQANGRCAMLLTFEPHPRSHFRPQEPLFRLTPPALKARRAAAAGVDVMLSCAFDATLASLTAEAFCRDLLGGRIGAGHVITGPDFRFGKGRAGDTGTLATFGAAAGFTTEVVPPVAIDGAAVSSTRIRMALETGDVTHANRLLGWEWSVTAEVRHGDKRGRDLGYPTANLSLDPSVRLAHGIYAVRATVNGISRAGVASFGRRPTFDGGEPKLEVHVFDFAGDLYGQDMEVAFVGYIRPELKFDSVAALVRRMDEDSAVARALLR